MKKLDILKILVPIDFSENCIIALTTASTIASLYSASIHLVHVTDSDYYLNNSDPEGAFSSSGASRKKLAELARFVIEGYRLPCFYTVEYGSISHCILKAALEFDADIIIMGKNGMNCSGMVYAGTQCMQVAKKSPVPVLIIPPETKPGSFKRVLFPVRPVLSVLDKYDAVKSFISKTCRSVDLLNLRQPDNEFELHIIHSLGLLLNRKGLPEGVEFNTEHYFKDTRFAECILERANSDAYDLLIITSDDQQAGVECYLSDYEQKLIHGSKIPLILLHSDIPTTSDEVTLSVLQETLTS